jgi:hypothetical protein
VSLVTGLVLAAGPRALLAQLASVRFEIRTIGDSTIGFSRGKAHWVRAGLTGTAVDPAQRDALVALFRVVQVRDSMVTAVITGQTTRVTTSHVALIDKPRRPWYRQSGFWLGVAIGAALGAGATLAL